MFEKVLIANRGEIALRIHRACREMGIQTVAVHSTADANAMHVRLADESVCIGPPPARDSYLNIPAILSAAAITGADAIHPGLGFLSENADFAEMVEEHGFTFIGPTPEHIRLMGDKVARQGGGRRELGIPTVPGSPRRGARSAAAARGAARDRLSGADQGGGGRRRARHEGRPRRAPSCSRMLPLAAAPRRRPLSATTRSISSAISTGRAISRSRSSATARAASSISASATARCSARTRSCSRRRPRPALNAGEREQARRRSPSRRMRKLGYRSAGTIEFLYQDGEFFFIEMNTRLQVEHPITEMISGIDLVREQIRIAAGAPLGYQQADIGSRGHAIECRINAENPETFRPSPGRSPTTTRRAASACASTARSIRATTVPPYYDSLVAKLIVHGASRNECLMRLRRALEEFVIGGIDTTIPLHQRLIADARFHQRRLRHPLARAVSSAAAHEPRARSA